MPRTEITEALLLEVVTKLTGWKYHGLLSRNKGEIGHWLVNNAGVFLNIHYAYGEALPQWVLYYIHPKHKTKVKYRSIGCSIEKPISSIVNDLNSRLLSKLGGLFVELEERTRDFEQETKTKMLEEYMLSALGKVLNLNEFYDHRYARAFRVEQPNGKRTATLKKWGQTDRFKIIIDEITPEQIIKIMQIVNS